MLADEIESPGDLTPDELLSRYEEAFARAVEAAGEARVREAADLSAAELDDAVAGDAGALPLSAVASVLALEDGEPDAETLVAEARNRIMLELSAAALNVDRVAIAVDTDLDPKEIQAKIEGRLPMTLREYATLRHFIATEADW